ncbi:MAG: SRPBCC family protein [Gemmatimonadota bacterium]|nr:SRPBCC family protein [Gemmatimonadota bacterium]
MKTSTFEASQTVPFPRDRVFSFFSDARNLERLTPPVLRFRVLTPEPIEMKAGTIIDYRLRLRGLPLRWRSEITVWEPPHRFADVQRRGPYRKWEHTHAFREVPGGTVIEDRVEYAVPGGRLVDRLFVRPDVERIFAYRQDAIERLLAD